jgi:hypothetical protein
MSLTKTHTAPSAAAPAAAEVPPRRPAVAAQREDDRSHFLVAQAESGRQMRAFIAEHYGDAE